MNEMKCQKCGHKLNWLRWNSEKSILICANDRCLAYRTPVQIDETWNYSGDDHQEKSTTRGRKSSSFVTQS